MTQPPYMSPDMFRSFSKDNEFGGFDQGARRRTGSKQKEKRSLKGRPLESYKSYFLIGCNSDGEIEYDSSANVDFSKDKIVNDAVQRIIHQCHKRKQGDRNVMDDQHQALKLKQQHHLLQSWHEIPPELQGPYMPTDPACFPAPMQAKRRRVNSQSPESPDLPISVSSSAIASSISQVQHGSYTDLSAATVNGQAPASQLILNIKVSDREKWAEWFTNAFLAVQQQYCRLIAKEWIRLLHPKKQSTHPYNGKVPRNQTACPNRTKPPYWPVDVMHKEPDHIDKDSRTRLLVHIIMNTPQKEISPSNPDGQSEGKAFDAESLLEPLRKKKEELKDKWWIIEEVIKARTDLEMYEDGGCDADQEVSVLDFEDHTRNALKDKKQKGKSQAKEDNDAETTKFNESRPSTPTVAGSPINSASTPVESDNEDGSIPMNASFTSTSTQPSTRSGAAFLQPKPRAPSDNRVGMIPQVAVAFGSAQPHLTLNYDQYDPSHQHQHQSSLSVQEPWNTTSISDSSMNVAMFSNELTLSHAPNSLLGMQHFQTSIGDSTPHNNLQMSSYQGSASSSYDFPVSYQPPGFSMHESYMAALRQSPRH